MGLDAVPFYLFLYDDKLYYPASAVTINPFRGYFRLSSQLPTGGGSARILVDFGDGSVQTGIIDTDFRFASQESGISDSRDGWYTLDGRRLSGQPTQKGLYIMNGNKTEIK